MATQGDRPVLLAVYGQGGHCAEMVSLVASLKGSSDAFELVTLGVGKLPFTVLAHFPAKDIRTKYNRFRNYFMLLPLMFSQVFTVFKIVRKFNIVGVVSTGPGIAIVPVALCRMMGIKTVFLESYCRFQTRSLSGRVMRFLAHRFLIQNKSLQSLYPKAQYCGRL